MRAPNLPAHQLRAKLSLERPASSPSGSQRLAGPVERVRRDLGECPARGGSVRARADLDHVLSDAGDRSARSWWSPAGLVHAIRHASIDGSQTRRVVPYMFICLSSIRRTVCPAGHDRDVLNRAAFEGPSKVCLSLGGHAPETSIPQDTRTSSSQLPTSHPYASADSGISGARA